MRTAGIGWVLAAALGCDEAKPRLDPDQVDAAVGSDARAPADGGAFDLALRDAAHRDARRPDARVPDGAPADMERADEHRGGEPDSAPDAVVFDAAPEDTAVDGPPDADLPDVSVIDYEVQPDAEPDQAAPDAGAVVLVSGVARAADQRLRVTVRGGGAEAETDADGRFEIAAAPGTELRFSAPDHETLSRVVDGPELADEVYLYRGVRISRGQPGRILFRFDDSWLLWDEGDVLYATRTDPIERNALVPENHEVVIGFAPGEESIVTRKRTEPGIAGDLYLVPLDGSPQTRLLVEAQPWARWQRDRILGMTHTREALSELRSVRPGEPDGLLAEGVPWLLVTSLRDGRIVWAEGGPDAFDVYRGTVDGEEKRRLNPPEAQASDRMLTTTQGAGVMWLTPGGELWRFEEAWDEARHLADDVIENPRPRFLAADLLLFWRNGANGLQSLHLHDGEGERLLVDGVRASSYLQQDGYFLEQPGNGLWHGTLEPPYEGGIIVPGQAVEIAANDFGIIAVADGVAWRVATGLREAWRLGGDGLSAVQGCCSGATAWRQADRSLWYLPSARVDFLDGPLRIAEGADQPVRIRAPEGSGVYTRGGEGGFYSVLFPALEPVLFERELVTMTSVDIGRALGRDINGDLWQVDPRDGTSFGWARDVASLRVSVRRGYAAYFSDRGLYLAPLGQ